MCMASLTTKPGGLAQCSMEMVGLGYARDEFPSLVAPAFVFLCGQGIAFQPSSSCHDLRDSIIVSGLVGDSVQDGGSWCF